MNVEDRLKLIKDVGEEIITEDELRQLLEAKKTPVAYDGFEPSGTDIHIAQGLLRAININKMTKAGCKFKILVADWHAWANNKIGGNLERIQKVGKYLIEVWKACDMDLNNVEFIWASDLVKDDNYWKTVMQIARNTTVNRIIRCSQIMGRKESETLQVSQILYPCMQCADIFYLKADITQLGMDQRKVNVLSREIGPKLEFWKPIVVSHHMLTGLEQPEKVNEEVLTLETRQEEEVLGNFLIELTSVDDPSKRRRKIGGLDFDMAIKLIQGVVKDDETVGVISIKDKKGKILEEVPLAVGKSTSTKTGIALKCLEIDRSNMDKIKFLVSSGKLLLTTAVKMSKSKPDTAIFMGDSFEDIKHKINKAYCPEGVIEGNPILEYCKYIIFEKFKTMKVERPEKWGGNLEFGSYNELESAFMNKQLHPMDLKQATAIHLNDLLEPVRKKIEKNRAAQNLVKEIANFKVTR
jgi:tyrosyl-tRNA synthetase